MSSSRFAPTTNSAFAKWAAYTLARVVLNTFFMLFYNVRYFGKRNVPDKGALLVICNHQSMYDPPLIGAGMTRRRCNYLARKTLFKFRPFAWLIDLYDAIPLDNEGIGFAGIKETLKRLKRQEAVLIFPEGARTFDGEIQEFKSGFITLAVRSKATIIPAAIAGCHEVWSREQKYPSPTGYIKVNFGEPIPPETVCALDENELHKMVEEKVKELYEQIRYGIK
jgi:1-acyl-sn-glycerol-3-phosphate acyltransferase